MQKHKTNNKNNNDQSFQALIYFPLLSIVGKALRSFSFTTLYKTFFYFIF